MTRRITRAKQLDQAERRPRSGCPTRQRGRAAGRRAPRALPDLQRGVRRHLRRQPWCATELSSEAIRLTRVVHRAAPRRRRGGRPARPHAAHRRPPPRAHRRRAGAWSRCPSRIDGCWNGDQIAEGVALITAALPTWADRPLPAAGGDRSGPRRGAHGRGDRLGPDRGPLRAVDAGLATGPVVALNHAVAVGMSQGPDAGLELLADLGDGPLAEDHRLHAVRAHLLEQAGDDAAAQGARSRRPPDLRRAGR